VDSQIAAKSFPAEALCGLVVPTLHQQLLASRDVIWFIDNEAAASCLIRGASGQPDVANIVQSAHIFFLSLGCRVWIEWIDSQSNPADGLSRDGLSDTWSVKQGWSLAVAVLPDWLCRPGAPQDLWESFAQSLQI